jgi:hypothetical protein
MWRLTRFPDSGITWQHIVSVMEDTHRRGVLAPTDVRYLEDARRLSSREGNAMSMVFLS